MTPATTGGEVPTVAVMMPLPFESPFADEAREIAEWLDRDILRALNDALGVES